MTVYLSGLDRNKRLDCYTLHFASEICNYKMKKGYFLHILDRILQISKWTYLISLD